MLVVVKMVGEKGTTSSQPNNFDKAIGQDPNRPKDWNNKGIALYRLGKYEEALECYDDAIKLSRDLPEVWNNKSIVLDHLGRYEEALEC